MPETSGFRRSKGGSRRRRAGSNCECGGSQKSDGGCCEAESRPAEQATSFGDQSIGKERNDADVDQTQGNGNLTVARAIAFPVGKHGPSAKDSCKSGGWKPLAGGNTSTWNSQGNGNVAKATVDQANEATQSHSASQNQSVGGCCEQACRCCGEVMRW